LAPFRKVFSLTPRFDQEHSAIAFPARWLGNQPPGADPILHRMMQDRIEELLADAAGTTFQRLRDEVQFELACQLLRSTTIPTGQIASIVGYSESSSFNRAFKRWAGVPPAEWRHR
jgi:AraC-like DNA-binding protein